MSAAVPDFSPFAATYARARPRYPPELYAWLASLCPTRQLAWDAATGNGQAAIGLAEHFDQVVATDISAGQILHANPHERVTYRVAASDRSGIEPGSCDLIAVATAIHWFPLSAFFAEAARVAKPDAVLAAWTYHAGTCDPPFDGAIHRFYWEIARPHLADPVQLVDDLYETIDFPGEPIEAPRFHVTAHWTLAQTLDYLRSWSGVAGHLAQSGVDLVAEFEPELARLWDDPATPRRFCMPIVLKARRLSGLGG